MEKTDEAFTSLSALQEPEQFLPPFLGGSSEHLQRKGWKAKVNSNKCLGLGNVPQKEREGEAAACGVASSHSFPNAPAPRDREEGEI